MLRYGFTLWFALTALLGPGVCYRALAASVARVGDAAAPAERTPAGTPDGAQFADSSGDATGQPPKCPPGQGKKAQALPPSSDAAAELRLPAGAVSLPPCLALPAFTTVRPARSDSAHHPPPLAGRNLLAAYCLLRC